jgi:iron(III) transport system ATP-binding protein
MLSGRVQALGGADGLATVESPVGVLRCRVDAATRAGDAVTLAIRPEHVALSADGTAIGGPNALAGEVEAVIYLGNLLDCMVAVGGQVMRVQLHPSVPVVRGARVQLLLPIEYCLAMRH